MRSHKKHLTFACVLFFLGVLSINGAIPSSTDPTDNLKKINTVNLLLPLIQDNLSSRTIQYVLKGYNGCYEWSSSHENILKVQGYSESGNNCHDHALVTLATNKPFNNIVWINAVDKETGDVLRCESRIAKIHRVEILTKLRTIDAGDTEIFEVLGYDSEGNAFSTLEGVRFRWSISKGGENLKILSLKDSHIKTTEIRRRLESSNHQTDIIAAEGQRTGKATVVVSVEEKDYTEKSHSVIISVIEHFVIFPDTELYVLPYARVQFLLAILKSERGHKRPHKIALPSTHYEWINEDVRLANIKNDGSLQCLALPGAVHIKVNDTHTVDNYKENTVNIVKPDSLKIQIKEYSEDSWEVFEIENILDRKNGIKFDNVWKLINGREYYVRVFLYDSQRNQIQITDNAHIKFAFDSQYIEIIKQKNHELHIRTKNLVINNALTATLTDVTSDKGTYIPEVPITSTQEYSIYSAVAIVRPSASLHLPLLEGDGRGAVNQQTFKVYAIGGTGNYEWVSRDLEVANIGREAILVPRKVGKTIIEVRDILNNKNMDIIEVEVSNIRELSFLEKLRETVTQQTGYVNVYATGGENNRKYSNCSFLAVNLDIENPTIVSQISEDLPYEEYLKYLAGLHENNTWYEKLLENSVQSEYLKLEKYEKYIKENPANKDKIEQILRLYRNYGMCSRSAFRGEFQGETTVKIGKSNQKGILQESRPDELILRVYDPFTTLDPILTYKTSAERQVILSFLSSFNWNLQGGPIKWDTRDMNTNIKVVSSKADAPQLIRSNQLSNVPAKPSFEVQCLNPSGKAEKSYPYTLILSSQNNADYRLPDPVRVESTIKVACKIPTSLEIYIIGQEEKTLLDTNKAHNLVRESYTIRKNQYYHFQTWVFDEQNSPFYNFSSLAINWNLDPAAAGSVEKADPRVLERKTKLEEDQYKRLILTALEGETVFLNAKSEGYKNALNILDVFPQIHDRVTITIKGNIDLDPDHYVLYNHPENSFDIKIKEGSGDFSVSVNETGIVKYNYNRATQTITVYPETLGYVRVIVKDNKLVSSQAATCDIIVAHPVRIRLASETNLLEENTQTTMTVSVYDDDDNRFNPENLRLMNVNLVTSADRDYALKITPQREHPDQFAVEGRLVGDYTFIASALVSADGQGREVRKVQSNSVGLHVFPKLQAQPPKLVLAPGCISAIKIIGGPSEQSKASNNVELVPSRTSTIDLKSQDSSVFSVKGNHVGEESVTFEVRYRDSGNVLTRVTVPVKVGRITGVEILSVSERKIHVGAQTRLIAGMKVDNEIFRFGLCPFEFTWTSKHDQVLHIHTPSASSIPCTEIGELIHQKDFHLKDYNLAVNATALSVGTAQIELHVKSEAHISTLQSHHLSAKANIHVINPITTDIPTYIGVPTRLTLNRNEIIAYGSVPTCTDLPPAHPTLLVLPPNVRYQIKTNYPDNQLRYTLSENDSKRAYVSETGEVATLFDKGKVTVIVEDINTNAELMMLNILITNVYSIFVENSFQAFNLPPGSETSLEIHLQDSLGRSFPSPRELKGLSLTFYTSNAQVLEGKLTDKNSRLQLTAKSEGVALCSVYLTDNPLVFDTFLVMVGTVVTPASPVYVHEGGNVNFAISSALAQVSGRSHWASDDSSVIEIDNRGRAKAHSKGETNVRFSDSVQYTTKVHVLKANRIELDGAISELSNIPSSAPTKGEYRIPLRVFSDNHQITSFSSKSQPIDNNLEIKCRALPLGWVEARTELVTDEYHRQVPTCVLTFEPSYPSYKAVPNSITLEVTVDTKDHSIRSSYTKQFSFEFKAAFKILDLDRKTLLLNSKHPSGTISIHTSNELAVYSHDDRLQRLSVDTSKIDRNGIATINVGVGSAKEKINAEFDIVSLTTGQKETIHVYYDPAGYATPTPNPLSGLNLGFLDMILLTVVVVVVAILIFSMKNLAAKNAGVAPQQPIGSAETYLGGGTQYRTYLNTSTQSSRPGESFLSHRNVSDTSRIYSAR